MWISGSGLAAPWPFLAIHAVGTALLLVRPRPVLRRMVGWVGALYIFGISWERISRESLRRPDTKTTQLIVAGLVLSTAMAWLGLRGRTQG